MTDSTFHQLYTADQRRTTKRPKPMIQTSKNGTRIPVHHHKIGLRKARNQTACR